MEKAILIFADVVVLTFGTREKRRPRSITEIKPFEVYKRWEMDVSRAKKAKTAAEATRPPARQNGIIKRYTALTSFH